MSFTRQTTGESSVIERLPVKIIPAVDIREGKCVRLYQGDYSRQTVFADDPLAVALQWQSQGAEWLHVVDLDGALAGKPQNLSIVEEIVKRTELFVEMGGGIRSEDTIAKMLESGVSRVVLGTLAVEDLALLERICHRFDGAVVVGIDARDGRVAVRGWQKSTPIDVLGMAGRMVSAGVKRIIYTDIARDGTLTEPDFAMTGDLVSFVDIPVIASGGVSSMEHLIKLNGLGVEGVIIGRALYTGDIDLAEAITVAA